MNKVTSGSSDPEWLDRKLFPFASRWITVDGARLHYVDEGEGPTLLLTHGSPMWSFMYRSTIKRLRDRYRCVAVDLPGLGLSTAPVCRGWAYRRNASWLRGFVRALDLRDVTLVTHATSGPSALDMAIREGQRIAGIVVSNSFAWPLSWHGGGMARMVRIVSSRLFGWCNYSFNLLPRLSARFARRTGRFSPAERAAIVGPYESIGPRRHLRNLLVGVRAEQPFFATIDARLAALADRPALLLFGTHDNGVKAGTVARWEHHLPNHRLIVLEQSAHFPLEDEPGAFNEHLHQWLEAGGIPASEQPVAMDLNV